MLYNPAVHALRYRAATTVHTRGYRVAWDKGLPAARRQDDGLTEGRTLLPVMGPDLRSRQGTTIIFRGLKSLLGILGGYQYARRLWSRRLGAAEADVSVNPTGDSRRGHWPADRQ